MNQRSQLCPFGYTIAFVTETVVPLFHDGVYAFLIASFEGSDAYDLDPSRNLGPAFMVGVEQHPLFPGVSCRVTDPRHIPARCAHGNDAVNSCHYRPEELRLKSAARHPRSATPFDVSVEVRESIPLFAIGKNLPG